MRHPSRLGSICVLLAPMFGCSSSTGSPVSASAGTSAAGGTPSSSSGGASTTGGSKASGGAPATGGVSQGAAGAVAASGGSSGTIVAPVFDCSATPSAAPSSAWVNATGNLAGMASECGNTSLVVAQPCSNRVIVGVAQHGLWQTVDGGMSWTQLGTGSGSAKITNRASSMAFDPKDSKVFWESGTWNAGGVYKTTDNGETFVELGSVVHNDSMSVDLVDPEHKTMLAGPHEVGQKVYFSSDAGQTWSNVGGTLPAASGTCNSTLVMGPNALLVGCEGGGIFRSSNSGTSWQRVGDANVLFQPLWAADGNIYWPGKGSGVQLSTDQGTSFAQSPGSSVAASVGAPTRLAELPDGRIVVVGADHLQASSDHGKSWKPIGPTLPAPGGGGWAGWSGVTYSALTKTFFIWRWDCGNNVLPNAIMSAGFDYATN